MPLSSSIVTNLADDLTWSGGRVRPEIHPDLRAQKKGRCGPFSAFFLPVGLADLVIAGKVEGGAHCVNREFRDINYCV